uniref:Putative site-specific tyrosine recombinase n=1 Tax=viral metagenome TaxID=1070528 RepID=A0A6M3IX83_9ZZZZ
MGVFYVKNHGWRFQFKYKKERYQSRDFKIKKEAIAAEKEKREEVKKPKQELPTFISFYELIVKRLDYVKVFNTKAYYDAYVFMARRWVKEWKDRSCNSITRGEIEEFLLRRGKVSAHAANKDLRYIKASFGWGIEMGYLKENPCSRLKRLPEADRQKYIPSIDDVWKVILASTPEVQDYLWCLVCTLGRMNEINQLTWDDVNFDERYIVLYTRKKKGGHKRGRKIPMANRLYNILSRRYATRDKEKPWVFWQRWYDNQTGEMKEGPFNNRSKIMRTACQRAGVKYFRFHALRHFGASLLENERVPRSKTQEILGHEKISTTDHYIQSITGPEDDVIKVLENKIDGKENDNKKGLQDRNCTK